ncbi:hypothetical protein VE02_02053 [Pseudogymnoascus sp. 03VT05]|nr:hypothetical protein VE02_02053 [Pseudogymnoascus sp. 03VT05]
MTCKEHHAFIEPFYSIWRVAMSTPAETAHMVDTGELQTVSEIMRLWIAFMELHVKIMGRMQDQGAQEMSSDEQAEGLHLSELKQQWETGMTQEMFRTTLLSCEQTPQMLAMHQFEQTVWAQIEQDNPLRGSHPGFKGKSPEQNGQEAMSQDNHVAKPITSNASARDATGNPELAEEIDEAEENSKDADVAPIINDHGMVEQGRDAQGELVGESGESKRESGESGGEATTSEESDSEVEEDPSELDKRIWTFQKTVETEAGPVSVRARQSAKRKWPVIVEVGKEAQTIEDVQEEINAPGAGKKRRSNSHGQKGQAETSNSITTGR